MQRWEEKLISMQYVISSFRADFAIIVNFYQTIISDYWTGYLIIQYFSQNVFLQCTTHYGSELHAARSRSRQILQKTLRIPRFGGDMQHHYPSWDLFVLGARYISRARHNRNEIHWLNLERGLINKCLYTQHVTSCSCRQRQRQSRGNEYRLPTFVGRSLGSKSMK